MEPYWFGSEAACSLSPVSPVSGAVAGRPGYSWVAAAEMVVEVKVVAQNAAVKVAHRLVVLGHRVSRSERHAAGHDRDQGLIAWSG